MTKFPGNKPELSMWIYNAYVVLVSITITWPFASMPELSLWIFLSASSCSFLPLSLSLQPSLTLFLVSLLAFHFVYFSLSLSGSFPLLSLCSSPPTSVPISLPLSRLALISPGLPSISFVLKFCSWCGTSLLCSPLSGPFNTQ